MEEILWGATVGRVANRIGMAEFELNGKKYELTKNDNGKIHFMEELISIIKKECGM